MKMTGRIRTSEQFIIVPGVPGGKVYVKVWCPEEVTGDSPVILLHDSLGCVETWRDLPQLLCQKTGRRVVAYDRLGFGRSSSRKELPSLRFVSEEAEIYFPLLLKGLDIERFSLLGYSVGGAMAVVCAARFGSQCESVVTESSQVFVEEKTRQGVAKAKADFEDPKQVEKLEKYHGDKARWMLDAWFKIWPSREFASWSLKEELPKIKCPVLAIHGDRDEYGSAAFPEMICALAGGPARMEIISDCGHVPHREKPELVLSLIAEFLKPGLSC